MGFTAIAMLLCEYAGLVAPHRQKGAANAKRMLLTNLLVAVLCLGGVTAHVTLIDYYNTLGITVYTWRPLESYWREGYLPAFISAAQSIKPPKPPTILSMTPRPRSKSTPRPTTSPTRPRATSAPPQRSSSTARSPRSSLS